MENVTEEQVNKVASLAKFDLSAEELEKFSAELKEVLSFVKLLEEVDVGEIETADFINSKAQFRKDEVQEERTLTKEETLKNAPEEEEGQFKVPPVFDQ